METSTTSTDYETNISPESIMFIAESVGIPYMSSIGATGASDIAEDVSCKLKIILQDAIKFMRHGRRQKLTTHDINHALKAKNLQPVHGYHAAGDMPFCFLSGNARQLHIVEEETIDLSEIIANAANSPKLPLETNLRAHWLCIDGIQPSIPENPPPVEKEIQKQECINPINIQKSISSIGKPGRIGQKLRTCEVVQVKQLAIHELSVEQQYFYKVLTETCVGAEEAKRTIALQSLSLDTGLHEMLPRLCNFITEGVRINVSQTNLAILIYLMRMVKAIVDNPTLYLEKYLHELIPVVVTCVVSKQLCSRPEVDNHWALRDFAARLIVQICRTYTTTTNNIQTRVSRIFSQALTDSKIPLPSLYGAISGLCELGSEVTEALVIPKIQLISDRLESCLKDLNSLNADKNDAGHVKTMIIKSVAPVLNASRPAPDILEDYKRDFGFLGPALCTAVARQRLQPTAAPAQI